MTAHALDVPRRCGVRQTRTGLLTAAPSCAMILVSLVRTSHPLTGQAKSVSEYMSTIISVDSCGSNLIPDRIGNTLEPQEPAEIFCFQMTGLSRGEPAQALTI